jgi:glycosyltransferase involved in cell wall biosynthesis
MNIAFFSDNFYPELSGITDTILISGRELAKRGHKVCYVGPRYSAKDYAVAKRPFPETPAADSQGGMQFYRLPSLPMPLSPTGQSRFVVAMGTSYALLQDFKPDIIHTQSPYGVGAEAKRAARKFGVPLVGTNHTAIEDFFPFGMRTIMRHIDARYYNHCDFVTTPYQTLIDRMREAGFTRPAKPLANPVELEHFTPPMPGQKEALRQTHNLQGPVRRPLGDRKICRCGRARRGRIGKAIPHHYTCRYRARSSRAELAPPCCTVGYRKECTLCWLFRARSAGRHVQSGRCVCIYVDIRQPIDFFDASVCNGCACRVCPSTRAA